jgi:hypothetical protein
MYVFIYNFFSSGSSILEAKISGNDYFSSADKPKLIELLRETTFRIPSKLLCSLFAISKTTCLNNR